MASSIRHAVRLLSIFAAVGAAGSASTALAQQVRRVDLQILVVSGGAADSATAMVKAGLEEALVPYTELDMSNPARTSISDAFLVDAAVASVRRGRFQAVVLPNDAPNGLTPAEKEALVRYEREFKIRQLDAYVYPSPAVGLTPLGGGTLDGTTASVTAAGTASAFSYLQGRIPFDDLDPATFETYAYVAAPAPVPAGATATYTPLIEGALPGGGALGAILGVYTQDGREELVLTAAVNQYQSAQKLLFPGILNWLTYGVHLGQQRLSFSVQVDDVFRDNGRWSGTLHCTLNENCPAGEQGPRILMKPGDVDALVSWQDRQGMKLDLAFNAGAYVDRFADAEANALGRRLLINRSLLRWVNHTYGNEALGCVRAPGGGCALDAQGQVQWPAYDAVRATIQKNIDFAARAGIRIDPSELVTGGHSGLRRPPADASDNPNLVRALSDLRIGWIAADASVERDQRSLGADARSVPRYPTNLFWNAATRSEEVQEYNWIFTSAANGGSGTCEGNNTCLAPVDPATGFEGVIVPREIRTALLHVLSNDPRPHYVHQSNLAEDRLVYPFVDGVLAAHRSLFSARAPLGNPTLREAGVELRNRSTWQGGRTRIEAFVQNGTLLVNVTAPSDAGNNLPVPLTVSVPQDSTPSSLTPYWGLRNGWQTITVGRPLQLQLDRSVPYGR